MRHDRSAIHNPDDLDILSAVWILSCNDENPSITYEGVKFRLSLPPGYNIRSLIDSRGELFRKKVPSKRLEEWKTKMLVGKHLPSWIKNVNNDTEREKIIKSLTEYDVFRNQFRTEYNAAKTPVEILDWGLQHIDRLRTAKIENREIRFKVWSTIWIPLFSMFVAFSAVTSSYFLQKESLITQKDIKRYELAIKPTQQHYSIFMQNIMTSYYSAYHGDKDFLQYLDKMESAFYNIEPYLTETNRETIWNQFKQFTGLCMKIFEDSNKQLEETQKDYFDSLMWYKKFFRKNLYEMMFKNKI